MFYYDFGSDILQNFTVILFCWERSLWGKACIMLTEKDFNRSCLPSQIWDMRYGIYIISSRTTEVSLQDKYDDSDIIFLICCCPLGWWCNSQQPISDMKIFLRKNFLIFSIKKVVCNCTGDFLNLRTWVHLPYHLYPYIYISCLYNSVCVR